MAAGQGSEAELPTPNGRALVVLSSVDRLPDGRSAGFWLPEAAYPWQALVAAGWDYRFVSTRPGRPPMGGVDRSDPVQRAFLADDGARRGLDDTVTAEQVRADDYDVIFVAGGHGALVDLPHDVALRALLGAYAAGPLAAGTGTLAAVCRGVGALLGVPGPDGRPLLAGRRVTGLSAAEERAVGLSDPRGGPLERRLVAAGARFEAADPFHPHVVVDGALITGQNPASTPELARVALNQAVLERAASI